MHVSPRQHMHGLPYYAMLCHAMPCYAMLCYAMLCYAMLCYVMPCYAGHAVPCHAMPCHAMMCCAVLYCRWLCYTVPCYATPCYSMLCHAMPCRAMLCYAMLCYAMLCYAMLCCAVLQVARIVGVNEGYIGQRCRGGGAQSEASAKHARFAAACALNALLCEQSAWTVEQTWGLPSSLTQQGQPFRKHNLTCAEIIMLTLSSTLALPASRLKCPAHCMLAAL